MTQENRKERNNLEVGKPFDKLRARRGNPSTGSGQDGEPASGDVAASGPGADASSDASPHPYEEILDEYPLREAAEDPVWSIRIVKGWMWFLAFSITGVLLLLVLGFFYD